ncbi:hypothetical protein BJF85_12245 [Saccharomonospora sp. CUA-673]|uniref:hypothetical protein n=1 Tax=Saccharomonospora sp. CUA-673 TaxID=1904969 RepID=UPI000960BEAE|nr:hypothetical protein [Saccharomonospora sp. CUA-673]OLT48567.1 hypothetical protein BJF85_12245 [Saccharomonospora sp. CUA-673]
MLYIVLILVLGALGLVVAALITADSLWAWISLGVSVVAGILLLIDWWRRRKAAKAAAGAAATKDAEGSDVADAADKADTTDEADTSDSDADADSADSAETDEELDEVLAVESTELMGASGELADPDAEPAEEQAPAEDVRAVAVLEDEVVVVDERPRYHLTECTWLETRETIPLPVREARELGFSPCGRCWPDATLARRSRERAEA